MEKIVVIATANEHKVEEFQRLAEAKNLKNIRFISAKKAVPAGMPSVDENENSFLGNAKIKARALKKILPNFWILADDSGLCVDELGGAPGIKSARFSGENSTSESNRKKLLEALRGVPEARRNAHFECALFLISPRGNEEIFSAKCFGKISENERDSGFGFGYDSIFVPALAPSDAFFGKTFAEISGTRKDEFSHRGKAFALLADFFRAQ